MLTTPTSFLANSASFPSSFRRRGRPSKAVKNLWENGGKIQWMRAYGFLIHVVKEFGTIGTSLTHLRQIFDPAIPPTLSLSLSVNEASLHLTIRTLQVIQSNTPTSFTTDSISGLSLRQRLGLAAKLPEHDESDQVFSYRGQEVRVREKARVESQDPSLMAVMAKLSALEHGVRVARKSLAIVMRADDED